MSGAGGYNKAKIGAGQKNERFRFDMVKLGEKIKRLRKEKNISQEVLAENLGVTFQAVSKWENGATMPDVAAIPAIAYFFGVSTDELFDFNMYEIEKQVMEICRNAAAFRDTDPEKGEEILKAGLKKFPGNDIILNNLLYVMRRPERADEVISICRSLIENTKEDDVKYDACRILAETYGERGEYSLAKETLELIPEIYFTKLQLEARILKGEDARAPAEGQKNLAAEMLVDMLIYLADYYEEKGEHEAFENKLNTAKCVILALKDDSTDGDFSKTFYEYYGKDVLEDIEGYLAGTKKIVKNPML